MKAELTPEGMVRIESEVMFPFRGDTIVTPGEARELLDGLETTLDDLERAA